MMLAKLSQGFLLWFSYQLFTDELSNFRCSTLSMGEKTWRILTYSLPRTNKTNTTLQSTNYTKTQDKQYVKKYCTHLAIINIDKILIMPSKENTQMILICTTYDIDSYHP